MKTKRIRARSHGVVHISTVSQHRVPLMESWDGATGYAAVYLTDTAVDRLIGALTAIRIERAGVRKVRR